MKALKLKRYVILGDFDKHAEQGFEWLSGFCWATVFFAVIYFAPVFCHIVKVWTR